MAQNPNSEPEPACHRTDRWQRIGALLCAAAWLLIATPYAAAEPPPRGEPEFSEAAIEFFEKQVRPILAQRCYQCHSGKSERLEGGLRVDSRAAILKGGDTGPAIVPGAPQDSLLIDAIQYGDTYQMPPKSKLPAGQIAALGRWVQMGAPWPPSDQASAGPEQEFDLDERRASHWAWRPVRPQTPPALADETWPRGDIDRFILAKLEQQGLQPASPADERTLIRRVYLDLIGLTPTPRQVADFLADQSDDALAKVVDQLLRSPHFGERWARHWLDLVRYGESRGHEFDYDTPNAYEYRDYVIRALNEDVPYDQFVKEHIAGDLLPEPRHNREQQFNESVLGTGFWFLGEWVHSPVDIRKDECDRFDNMIDVFSKTFLGLTVACARCHDHKFDAISQRDYYALAGYLQSSEYRQVRFETELHNRRIAEQYHALEDAVAQQARQAMLARQRAVAARLAAYLTAARRAADIENGPDRPADQLEVTVEMLDAESLERIEALATQQRLRKDTLAQWVAHLLTVRRAERRDDPFFPFVSGKTAAGSSVSLETEPSGELIHRFGDRLNADGLAFGLRPVQAGELLIGDRPEAPFAGLATQSGARRHPFWNRLSLAAGVGRDAGRLSGWDRAGKTVCTDTFELNDQLVYYLVRGAGVAYAVVDSHRMINGPLHGSLLKPFNTDGQLKWIAHDLRRYAGHNLRVEFVADGEESLEVFEVRRGSTPPALPASAVACVQSSLGDLSRDPQALQELVLETLEGTSGRSSSALLAWIFDHPRLFDAADAVPDDVMTEFWQKRAELAKEVRTQSRTALAMCEASGRDEQLLIRGNPRTPAEGVPRRFLASLGGESTNASSGPDRVAGSGRLDLARRVADPSNPFTSRVIVNRIWAHLTGRGIVPTVDNFGVLGQPPTHPELLDHLATRFMDQGWSIKRMIREIVLSRTYRMSSQLDPRAEELDPQNVWLHRMRIRRLEGEAIRDATLAISGRLDRRLFGPSVPVHLTAFMQGRGRPGKSGPVDGAGRRSIYIAVRRNFLSPLMLTFDTPQPFSTVGRRSVSNVPAQALTLLNDPFFADQARVWARRMIEEQPSDVDARLQRIYLWAFSRPPTGAELEAARHFLSREAQAQGISDETIATDEDIWTDYCHALMNVKEYVFLF